MNRKRIIISFIMVLLLVLVGGLLLKAGFSQNGATTNKKVLILGFDGLDPQILERLVQAGKLPNFKALMDGGDYRPLATSIPPLSPVAWANFITGMNPGGHGIFDFIHRDPQTMIPYLSTSKTEPAKRTLRLGSWVIPLSSGKITLLRQGKAFWQILEGQGIPTTIVRAPANFPPVKSKVRQLSGMGTPDLHGTYGIFSFFTDEPIANYKVDSGGDLFPVRVVNHQVQSKLLGPGNSFRVGAPPSAVDFSVLIDPAHPVAKIVIQDRQYLLKEGEWTPWIQIQFEMIPLLQSVRGMVRFYLKEVHPHFKLYATPINIDPSAPALPISTPEEYSQELFEEIGPFYTQGMSHDTKALSRGILEDGEFLQQAKIVFDEHTRMFDYELSRFKSGLLFFYTDRVDQLGHMFWRTMDPKHPVYDPASKYARVIEEIYQDMDKILGKALRQIDAQTTLMVMSDHGFAPFYRAFNLNTWLREEGYIKMMDSSAKDDVEFFANVNWRETKAYGLGINGLYINLNGRERGGVIQQGVERDSLVKELSEKLLSVRDPKTGQLVIRRVYKAEDVYTGSARKEAPDLIIGYSRGYRVSWESVLGKFSRALFEDNTDKWSGDHAMAAELVPGILVVNKKIKSYNPALYDLAPTILNEFGISKANGMVGKRLW
ncbi:MAG: alkaline phosphatase family protein [Deltaproteobacteria bacterium]|nr:alkaline phosphatase family protein [Deltaproteobacteria bacterium]